MKWTGDSSEIILSPRTLNLTPERWSQFLSKVDRRRGSGRRVTRGCSVRIWGDAVDDV